MTSTSNNTLLNIIKEHCPDVLFDRQLTPAEAKQAIDNLEQAKLYPEQSHDEYLDDYRSYEEQFVIKENNIINEELVETLESNPDFEPYEM